MAQMNLSIKQKETHRHREQTCDCQGGEGVGRDGIRVWVSRCKLKYTKWINKALLYSTRNYYIQYPVINHNGK